MTITVAALIAAIAFAHIASIAWVFYLMATTDLNPSSSAFIGLAAPATAYTVPIAIAARYLFKQFDTLLRDASANPDPETP